jgi:hypothetical protein
MTVTVSIADLSARQTKRLGEFLANMNVQRAQQGKVPFSDLNAWATSEINDRIADHIRTFDVIEGQIVQEAYVNANNTAQAAVKTALGLP